MYKTAKPCAWLFLYLSGFFCSAAKIINACKKQFSLKHTVFYPASFYGVI